MIIMFSKTPLHWEAMELLEDLFLHKYFPASRFKLVLKRSLMFWCIIGTFLSYHKSDWWNRNASRIHDRRKIRQIICSSQTTCRLFQMKTLKKFTVSLVQMTCFFGKLVSGPYTYVSYEELSYWYFWKLNWSKMVIKAPEIKTKIYTRVLHPIFRGWCMP